MHEISCLNVVTYYIRTYYTYSSIADFGRGIVTMDVCDICSVAYVISDKKAH